MEDQPEVPQFPVELLIDDPTEVEEVGRALLVGAVEHPAVTAFAITGPDLAMWAIERLGHARRTMLGIRQMAEAWRARIDQWEHEAVRPFEASIEFLDERLRSFALEQRRTGGVTAKGEPKIKSVKLPNGTISTRKGTTTLAITNEADLLVWLEANMPDAVKTTKKPLTSIIAAQCRYVLDEGAEWAKVVHGDEIVPGIVAVTGPDTATVQA